VSSRSAGRLIRVNPVDEAAAVAPRYRCGVSLSVLAILRAVNLLWLWPAPGLRRVAA